MRFKYYLRGCGFGILLTVVILAIGFHRNGGMSDDKIRQRASELGMVTPDEPGMSGEGENAPGSELSEPSEVSGQEPPRSGPDADGAGNAPGDSSEAGPDGAGDSPEDGSGEGADGAGDSPGDGAGEFFGEGTNDGAGEDSGQSQGSGQNGAADDGTPKTVTIRVRRHEVCEELAEELEDLGLLQDAQAFSQYMYEKGYDSMLRVGKYTFAFGMDMEEIAKILIANPE